MTTAARQTTASIATAAANVAPAVRSPQQPRGESLADTGSEIATYATTKYAELTSARRSPVSFGDHRRQSAAEADALSDAPTIAAAIRPSSDENCSATARITIPATRIAQPTATAPLRCDAAGRRAAATAEATKT